jgi:PRTRC genetic system protein F
VNGIGPLPRIGAGVPHLIRPDAAHQADATLARYLLRAGVVRAADVPRAWLDPLAVCCAALERWAHAACGTLHHVAPDFHLELLKGEDAGVMLTWGARGKPQTLAIGAALEALEARVPDLGAEALRALDYQYSYRLFTPRDMLDQARSLYWYGDDDEATVLAECAGDERAEVERAMVTRAKLDAAYPAWAG